MLNPLLVAGRKFDIRIFVVMCYTKRGDSFKGYFYQDGYVRTSWKKFSLKSLDDRECHLTNDAVQKKAKG
jgi:tubulin monoglycylase TTLL3/8